MYHIKHDKRAQASVELICAGLLRLMGEKPFSAITVSDLQRVSSVSRSTFYRNFDHPEDVLELLCDRGFAAAFAAAGQESLPVAVFRYWSDHSSVLEALVSIHRTDILFSSLRRSAVRLEHLKLLVQDERQYDYFVSIIASGMIGILVTWTEHGRAESQDEVLRQLAGAFSAAARLVLS